MEVLDHPYVRDRFINNFKSIHGVGDPEAEMFYEKEKNSMARIIAGSEGLKACTGFSTYGVFLDICSYGLTIENGSRPYMYITFFNFQDKADNTWKKHMQVDLSPYGELALRIKAGQILYADRPVVVYEGDQFQPSVNDKGQKIVQYKTNVPRTSSKIIGSFIRLVRPDGSFDFYWMLPEDVDRLKAYSEKKNKTSGSNALYNSCNGEIDPGFLEAKTIKHSFKTFPTIRLGNFSRLQKDEAQATDYGLGEDIAQLIPEDVQPPENTPTPENDPFGGAAVQQQAVTVTVDDDEPF